MSEDVANRLRGLAQDHRQGRLTLHAYRKLRAPLIDSLSGWTALAADPDGAVITQPRAGVVEPPKAGRDKAAPDLATPAPRAAATAAQTASVVASRRPSWQPIVAGGAVALLAVVAIALWFSRSGSETGPGAAAPAQDAAIRAVIQPFVDAGDWSDERIDMLNAELVGHAGELKAAARATWFQQFVDSVRTRVKEQQALGGEPLTPETSPLAALAVTLGLDLLSPDSALRIVTSAAGPAPAHESAPRVTDAPAARVAAPAPPAAKPDADASQRTAKPAPDTPSSRAGAVADPVASSSSVAAEAAGTAPLAAGVAAPKAAEKPAAGGPCRGELARSRLPLCQDALGSEEPGPLLAVIPAGAFQMGNKDVPAERPVLGVTIAKPFAIGVHEVSQAEFRAFCSRAGKTCAAQPWPEDDYPVVNVSWDDATEYAQWLSSVTGHRYRLPTEAEWEYAARAGETGLYPGGDALSPTDAHFSAVGRQAAPARRSQKYNRNAFRLHHAIGNVREWVEDGWRASLEGHPADGSARAGDGDRVARGGSYVDGRGKLRLTTREGLPAGTRDALTGFRVAREL